MIEHINNNEGGGDVRSKLNEVINLTNQVPNKVERLTTAQNGNVAVWQDGNLIDSGLKPGGGTDVNIPDWVDIQGDPLPLGFVVRFSGRLWVSKVEDNQNNQPPIDAEIDENDYWIVTSENEASGTPTWTAGLYKTELAEVFVLNTGDNKYYKYILRATVPYVSSDFEAELLAGIWQSTAGGGGHTIADSDEQFAQQPVLKFTGAVNVTNGVGETVVEVTAQPIIVDATPTDGSANAVSSNGVFDALVNKMDIKTIDTSLAWDGTSYTIPLSTETILKRTINNTITSLTFSLSFPADAATKSRKITVIIDNSFNTSAISTITFTGGNWRWDLGVQPTGLAIGAIATLELYNENGTDVKPNWTVRA